MDCALNYSITVVCVNTKLLNRRSILDFERLIVCTDNQFVVNFCLKCNVNGTFDNSVTSCTLNSKLVSSVISNSKVGIDVNSAVNLNVTKQVCSAAYVEVFRNACATSYDKSTSGRCLPSRRRIGCQSEVTSNDRSVSARINFA